MRFEDAVEIILKLEGGSTITNDPNDPGGLTKWGISLRAHPELGATGLRRLTKAEAIEIYRNDYWIPSKADKMPDLLKLPIFDSAVNQGVLGSAKILQKALNDLGKSLVVDGIIGPITLAAIRDSDPIECTALFLQQRLITYRSLSGASRFGKGWERRVLKVAISIGASQTKRRRRA